jgi:general secretion pathway protein K
MLIVVLWVMGLVSLAVGGIAAWSMHELRLGQTPLQSVQLQAVGEAALYHAVELIGRDDPTIDHLQELWASGIDPGTQQQLLVGVPVGPGSFSIGTELGQGFLPSLIDEERKLNVNTATTDVLRQLIALRATPGVDPQAVAASIVAWRTSCEELPAPCHAGPLDTVEELLAVPGVSPELFAALAPYVTVHGSGAVNANTASADVLTALGCDGAALIAQRAEEPFQTPPPSCPGTSVNSTAFTIPISARLSQWPGRTIRRQAIIDRDGQTLAWSAR